MTDDQGSSPLADVHRTAIGAAVSRAFHLFRDGEPKILRDEFASQRRALASTNTSSSALAWTPMHCVMRLIWTT
jgi:hypothetical protein